MEWLQVMLVCVAGAILCSVIRPQRPEMALGLAIASGMVAVGMCLPTIRETADILRQMLRQTGTASLTAIFRATGIALISEFAAQLCRDAGESALAGRAELAGKAAMAAIAAPMLLDLTRDISDLLSACA